eukprot:1781051-Pyramimonas_sp.AAC.1
MEDGRMLILRKGQGSDDEWRMEEARQDAWSRGAGGKMEGEGVGNRRKEKAYSRLEREEEERRRRHRA